MNWKAPPKTEKCMYCTIGKQSTDAVKQYFTDLIIDVEKVISMRSPNYISNCKFLINFPTKSGASMGHCYVWVTNKEVFRMLMGLNYDGAVIAEPVAEPVDMSAIEILSTLDWSQEPTVNCTVYVPPPNDDIKIYSAKTDRVGKQYVEGSLFCLVKLRDDYPTGAIIKAFQPFVTKGKLTTTRSGSKVTLAFSNKDDAYFALYMRKKYNDGNIELSFNHFKKNDY
jgi:hypothetical protein